MIRQFQYQDAASCSGLIHACVQNDPSYSLTLRKRICGLETAQAMTERARLFYVAVYESDDGVLGVAGLDMNEIRLLCVSPEHRRLGIGRSLLEHIKAMVPGILFSDIFVYSSLQAVEFYRAGGFCEKGPFVLDIGGEQLQTIFMTCSIHLPQSR
jgi:GNAT superfamily N-acetyltransferase